MINTSGQNIKSGHLQLPVLAMIPWMVLGRFCAFSVHMGGRKGALGTVRMGFKFQPCHGQLTEGLEQVASLLSLNFLIYKMHFLLGQV